MNVDVMILCVYLVRALGFTYCLASHIAQVVSQDTREQSQAVAHYQTHAQTSQRYTRCCADREGGKTSVLLIPMLPAAVATISAGVP